MKQEQGTFRQWVLNLSLGAGMLAVLVGITVLAGWIFQIENLKSVMPDWIAMKANTAVSFVLLGVALLLLQQQQEESSQYRIKKTIANVCASIVIVVAALSLAQYILNVDFRIDQLFFTEDPEAIGTFSPGRMAPLTALSFIGIGTALLLLDFQAKTGRSYSQFLVSFSALMGWVPFVGYIYGLSTIQSIHIIAIENMAFLTALTVIVLSIGVVFARPEQGMMPIFMTPGPGGIMLRRLLPSMIFIPVLIRWLIWRGEQTGYYDATSSTVFYVSVSIVFFVTLILATSVSLYRLHQTRNQIEEALHHAKQDAELANSRKSQFLTHMSHELRTPLHTIITGSNICSEEMFGPLDPKYREYIQMIAHSGDHLLQIINDLLDIAKIEAGKLNLYIEDVEIQGLVEQTLQMVEPLSSKKQQTLVVELATDLPDTCFGDKTRLKQALCNLLSNAIKFSPENTRIELRCQYHADDEHFVFSVKDQGPGIPPEELETILEPFEQGSQKASSPIKGTGLGLHLTKKLIEYHGGRLVIDSQVGIGSVFSIILPVSAAAPMRELVRSV